MQIKLTHKGKSIVVPVRLHEPTLRYLAEEEGADGVANYFSDKGMAEVLSNLEITAEWDGKYYGLRI